MAGGDFLRAHRLMHQLLVRRHGEVRQLDATSPGRGVDVQSAVLRHTRLAGGTGEHRKRYVLHFPNPGTLFAHTRP